MEFISPKSLETSHLFPIDGASRILLTGTCNVVRSPVCQDEQVEQGTQVAVAEAPAVNQALGSNP